MVPCTGSFGRRCHSDRKRQTLCPSRLIPPWPDNEPGVNRAGYFNQYNQGKRSLTLDLKAPEAIDIAKTLVSKSEYRNE